MIHRAHSSLEERTPSMYRSGRTSSWMSRSDRLAYMSLVKPPGTRVSFMILIGKSLPLNMRGEGSFFDHILGVSNCTFQLNARQTHYEIGCFYHVPCKDCDTLMWLFDLLCHWLPLIQECTHDQSSCWIIRDFVAAMDNEVHKKSCFTQQRGSSPVLRYPRRLIKVLV